MSAVLNYYQYGLVNLSILSKFYIIHNLIQYKENENDIKVEIL